MPDFHPQLCFLPYLPLQPSSVYEQVDASSHCDLQHTESDLQVASE